MPKGGLPYPGGIGRPKPKKRKRSARTVAKRAAIHAFNKWVRLRDGACVICGATEPLNAGHFLSATRDNTRFDEDNVHCQCVSCNFEHERNPLPYTRWMQGRYGDEFLEDLERRWHTTRVPKYTEQDFRDIANKYKALCKEIE